MAVDEIQICHALAVLLGWGLGLRVWTSREYEKCFMRSGKNTLNLKPQLDKKQNLLQQWNSLQVIFRDPLVLLQTIHDLRAEYLEAPGHIKWNWVREHSSYKSISHL